MKPIIALLAVFSIPCWAEIPRDAVPFESRDWPVNFRIHLKLSKPSEAEIRFSETTTIRLPSAASHDIAVEHPAKGLPLVRIWTEGKPSRKPKEIKGLLKTSANTPIADGTAAVDVAPPEIVVPEGVVVEESWVQSLERSDHSELLAAWGPESLAEGKKIYESVCVVCHGTMEKEGSLPTALKFGRGDFKNGSDPYSMHATLTKGYGQMVAQPQYTTAQKYAVIHYIRETYLKPHKPEQALALSPAYINRLPKGLARGKAEVEDRSLPPFERMDVGPVLFWTYQIAKGNIAQKGIAIRLDDGPGGVGKGKAWMVYDHDTMRVAAATTGSFVDWKGIAFDGSHGTHTSLAGDRHFVNPPGPGWASADGTWDDTRPLGRDDLPYGPLDRKWVRYDGLYMHGNKAVIAATVHGTRVLETPGWIEGGNAPVFVRTINVAASPKPLLLRVAPDSASVHLTGSGSLARSNGFWVASLPGGSISSIYISRVSQSELDAMASEFATPGDPGSMVAGGAQRWPGEVVTTSVAGEESDSFVADTFPLPLDNPWQSWLRPGGFDFTPDGKAAVVAMWNGDVWRVDGVMDPAPATLRWRRIAGGLFQPLGVKFRGSELFITCRDQIARLVDLNGDGEIDFIGNFNNDHQVTEHFHEFAMGLQTDEAGNFYYAKSGRHALAAVVPHHGTVLRVSADGTKTDILATGLRAANGLCLNDDGTFFVTDQEGFWTPKNRINRMKPGGFYGNMFGYTDVTDASDSAMEPPMVWITNDKDRSPAELVWVPKNAWGSLGGTLLNLSYGTGRAFVVPHEKNGEFWQGAVCELPMPAFATGIMRGRFASDGALYTCGMFAWAGNAIEPGGFHRIRRTSAPANVPIGVHAVKGGLNITFSEALDPAAVAAGSFRYEMWQLHRSAKYGSKHIDQHPLAIQSVKTGSDPRVLTVSIPDLVPTQCYELDMKFGSGATRVERNLHGTIHRIAE